MYLEHFRFNELPFSITPNTSFFMNRAGYQDALNVLLVALRSGEGFVKVTGEVGVGKTILCRKLMNSLGPDYIVAYIHNPYIKPASLLFAIADALSITYPKSVTQYFLLKQITESLHEAHRNGKKIIVCLDEVQAMPVQTLESLRLLTNLETEYSKLIQVVLFGQPELDALLNQPSVRQLKQRITFSYRLLPLNKIALKAYLQHRLDIAGYKQKNLFTKKAVEQIFRYSNGIPRLINILCHKALIAAYGEGTGTVTHKHIAVAVQDMDDSSIYTKKNNRPWTAVLPKWLFGGIGMLGLIYIGVLVNGLLG